MRMRAHWEVTVHKLGHYWKFRFSYKLRCEAFHIKNLNQSKVFVRVPFWHIRSLLQMRRVGLSVHVIGMGGDMSMCLALMLEDTVVNFAKKSLLTNP